MLTFKQFKTQVDSAEKPEEWRYGQFIFNFLHQEHSKLADFIRGTKKDPFYKTQNLDWDYLESHWNDKFD